MLPHEARNVLARLELVSHGSTQAWNSSGRPAERDPRPSGEAHPPHLKWQLIFMEAELESLPALIHAAWRELDTLSRGNREDFEEEDPDELRKDVLKMTGYTPKEIANRLGGIVTQGQVKEWREKADMDVSTGYPTRPGEDKREKVLRLHAAGLGPSEIARQCGMVKQAVSQMLKRAA